MFRKFTEEFSQEQCQKAGRRAKLNRRRSWPAMQLQERTQRILLGPLNLGWPFRIGPHQGNGAGICALASTIIRCRLLLRGTMTLWDSYFQQRSIPKEGISFESSAVNTFSKWEHECLIPEGDSWVVQMPQHTSDSWTFYWHRGPLNSHKAYLLPSESHMHY